jgi:hypothetical protein
LFSSESAVRFPVPTSVSGSIAAGVSQVNKYNFRTLGWFKFVFNKKITNITGNNTGTIVISLSFYFFNPGLPDQVFTLLLLKTGTS